MRTRLTSLARRLVRRLSPSPRPAAPRATAALRTEELEERVALSAVPGAAAPVACHCPFCTGMAAYTFGSTQSVGGAVVPSKWAQPGGLGSAVTITYSFSNLLDGGLGGGLSAATIRAAIQEALGRWASVAPLRFVEVADSGPAPSQNDYSAAGRPMLRFGRIAIDGPYNTLAYTYYPGSTGLAGDLDFDTAERWSVNPSQGIDLLEVATHEIGHALGLGHEPMPSSGGQQAIMNPYYGGHFNGLGTSFLYQDDINGIRALYGSGVGSVTPLAPAAAPTDPAADARVLQSYYQRILGRSGSAAEIQGHLDARAGGASWSDIAQGFVNSVEANGRVVDQYYATYLGRAADAPGRAAWAQALSNGMTREQFAVGLLTSAEFTSRYAAPDAYAWALYNTVLGRQGSAAEVAAAAGALQSGALSRAALADGFVRSSEAYGRAVNASYLQYLNRSVESAARQAWVGALSSGQLRLTDMDMAILASREYVGGND